MCLESRYKETASSKFRHREEGDENNNNNYSSSSSSSSSSSHSSSTQHSSSSIPRPPGSSLTPRFVYRYFPLSHRLRQLFAHPVYSRFFLYGDSRIDLPGGEIGDIHQADVWKTFKAKYPLKSEEGETGIRGTCDRRVAFLVSADGASLSSWIKNNKFSYVPIILSLLNWPIWIRSKVEHLLFTGICPINAKNTSLFLGNIRKHNCRDAQL